MNYDVIIIGQALSGLTAGALLSRKNLRVLNLTGPWSPSPPLRPLPEPTGPVLALFEKLRIADAVTHKKPDELVGQVVIGERRLDWYNNRISLFADIKREFGDEVERARGVLTRAYETGNEYAALLARMPQCFFDGFFGERKAKKAIADFFPPALQKPGYREEGAAWDSAFRSQLHWVSFLPDSLSEFFQSALFSIVAPGVASLEDSAQKLKNVLRDRISMSRGRTMEGIRISGLAFDGKKLVGVKWEGEEHFFASKIVIWCESPKLVLDMLPESFRRKKPFLAIEALSPLGFWATHRFPVNEDALPLGLCDRLAFVEADEKYPIILQREFQPAESGETVFNLSLYLPYKGETEKELWQRLEPLFESALKRVKGVMPFAKIGACASKKDEIMRSLFPVYPPKSDCPMGITAYSPLTTVPNLLLGGPHLWPSLGMVGELMLGQQLAMICVEKLSK